MPYVPDASSAIRVRRVNATTTADPEKKSRTFVAPLKQGVLSAVLRSTDTGRGISPTNTFLSVAEWKSPQFNGRIFVK